MATCLPITDLKRQGFDDAEADLLRQTVTEYLRNAEKSVDILVACYQKQILSLSIELAKLKAKQKELKSTEVVCSKCRDQKSGPKDVVTERDPDSRILEDRGIFENQDLLLVAETVPERLESINSRLCNGNMVPRVRAEVESFVPETCDFPKLGLESYPHLPMESSTPLVSKTTSRNPVTSRVPVERPVNSNRNDGNQHGQDFKSRPSIEETVLEGSLVVLQTFKDRNSLPNVGQSDEKADNNDVETVERDQSEENYEDSVPSSPVIGRSSSSCSKDILKTAMSEEFSERRKAELFEDCDEAVNAIGRQLYKNSEGPMEDLEVDVLPETPCSELNSPNNDFEHRPVSPVIACQRRFSARKTDTTEQRPDIDYLEAHVNDEPEGTIENGVDSIFKETILEDLGANVVKDLNECHDLGTEDEVDIISSVQVVTTATAKPNALSLGSEEIRPKAKKFTYTKTSRLADGQSRLKLVGSKKEQGVVKAKKNSGQETAKKNSGQETAKNNGSKKPEENAENTVLLLDDSFDIVTNRNAVSDVVNFKYQEVVRKQADRRKLTGRSCKECQSYYKDSGLSSEEIRKRMASCSRHREKFPNPETPPNFWQLDFPPTPDAEEEEIIRRPKRLKKSPLAILDEVEPVETFAINERPIRSKRGKRLPRRL